MKEYIVKGRLDNKTGFMSFTVKQELIRCKDCKYGKEDEDGTIECTFWDFMDHTHHNDPEGFCYRAKRRGE